MKEILPNSPHQIGDEFIEVLRVSQSVEVPGKMALFIRPEISDEPTAWWGLLLVDIARHVANAYAALEPQNENVYSTVLKGIREWFDMEWDYPTDTPQGDWENTEMATDNNTQNVNNAIP